MPRERSEDLLLRDVARRVQEIREARGWTQERLADALDISEVYVRRIEGARVNLSVRALARLAHALGVLVGAFFEVPASRAKRAPGRPPAGAASTTAKRRR